MVDLVSPVIIVELMDDGELWIPGVRRWGAGPESRMGTNMCWDTLRKRPYITIIQIL